LNVDCFFIQVVVALVLVCVLIDEHVDILSIEVHNGIHFL